MLLNSIKADYRENAITKRYFELISAGAKPSEILVLTQNSNSKKRLQNIILEKIPIDAIEKINVHSFFSIVYNTLQENWCFIENSIKGEKSFILPNLVGLEVSQFLLKDLLKNIVVKGYNSKKSLLHQIFRRYSLIVQNNLSNDEVKERAKILKESFADDAELIIKKLMSTTLKTRSFDYLRQTLIFNFVYRNTDYFKNIKYLLVDDADEMTPVCFDFIEYLKPQLKDRLICFDTLGSSRCGYLSADTSVEYKLKKLFNEEVISNEKEEFINGDIIFSNVMEDKHEPLERFSLTSLSKRAEILDYTVSKIKELLDQKNISPKDIAVISPVQDDMLKFTLREMLSDICDPVFLSGSEKLVNNSLVKASLNILRLMLGLEVSEMDLRSVISDYIGIPVIYSKEIFDNYKKTGTLPEKIEKYDEKYQKFYKVFSELKNKNEKLSLKVYKMFTAVKDFVDKEQINKFNFFLKELRDFETVLGEQGVNDRIQDIIVHFENSIIAENPNTTLEILQDDLIIATPQKIIDNKISTKYQFWLDVSHSDWVKTDTGPLYNAWVMQKDWSKDEYTVEDDIFLSRQKTARILRKLLLLAQVHTYAVSSLFDASGTENLGGIQKYIESSAGEVYESKHAIKLTPRDDQRPVLEYKKGSMAISAVPGAGKTTILLLLIIKLMSRGINPNNIYVLTYMDSAARNFRERIKNMCPESVILPNISTIHGLALRILKENSNFERLSLTDDFDICDDTQRMRIIRAISGKIGKTELEDFDKAISVFKLQEGNIETPTANKKIEKFKNFYKEYQAQLKEANMIDYDDILILSVKLLENNPDILEYYQNICEYIIEDEAQDSSGVQQRLIGLLSGKNKNLIRCGDINQAITTTFSNADVEGFRHFIQTADKTVEMNHSQRCAQEVMNLANKLVDWGLKLLPKAFFKSYMLGVEGKNPVSQNAISSFIFENPFAERNYVLKEIKNILTKDKKATVGILLRGNFQVAAWTSFINDSGLKTITRSESLGQKGVFNTIFSILKFVQTPFDNEVLSSTYEKLAELGFYKQRLQLEIKNSERPFICRSCDDIENNSLAQFLLDMQYWLASSTLPLEELVIRIGLFYYTSDIEKSNVYLIAILIKRLNASGDFDLTLQRLEELAKKPSLSGFKFFSEEEDKEAAKGKVQIMTLHKSKGDEFDYVFLPELTEKMLSIDVSKAKLKTSSTFMEDVKSFNPKYKHKSEQELKEFNAEETLRLLYVAITRAQKKLYLTSSSKNKFKGQEYTQEPSIIFHEILQK